MENPSGVNIAESDNIVKTPTQIVFLITNACSIKRAWVNTVYNLTFYHMQKKYGHYNIFEQADG